MTVLNNADSLYVGVNPVDKVYIGEQVVWENGVPVVWNQLFSKTFPASSNGVTFTKNGAWYVLNGVCTSASQLFSGFSVTANRVYLAIYRYKNHPVNSNYTNVFQGYDSGNSKQYYVASDASISGSSGEKLFVFIPEKTTSLFDIRFRMQVNLNYTGSEYTVPQVIDLTQMFGAGNEPTDITDARIQWIKDYALEHPEYNSGETVLMKGVRL